MRGSKSRRGLTRAVPRLEPSSHLSEQQQMLTQAASMRSSGHPALWDIGWGHYLK
jgi:hypothetical protein